MVKEEKLEETDVDMNLISRDKRFQNLSGIVFGELTVLGPYKKEGKTLKWVASCSCGNVIKTSRSKLKQRGKTSCVECSEKKLRDKNFTPLEDKKTDLISKRKDLEILNILGDTWADEWEVLCSVCNTSYTRKYRDLVRGVKGCKCRNVSRKKLDEKSLVVDKYCKKLGFTFKGFEGSPIKVNMHCPTHNRDLRSLYHNIKSGKIACKECSSEIHVPYNLGNKEDFIERSEIIHGAGRYDYSEVSYKNSGTKVKIRCNKCNTVNLQTPAGHLTGRGCKVCTKTGFKLEEPCWLYLIKLTGMCEEFYKIGVTNNLDKRMYNLGLGSWFELEYVDVKRFDKGWKGLRIEQSILNEIQTRGCVDGKYQPKGTTEVFSPEELDFVERMIEEDYLEEKFTI